MKLIEFLIDRIINNSQIIGRNCGDDIKIRDEFTVTYLSQAFTNEEETWDELIKNKSISIKVKEINLYGKSVKKVPSGYVCELIVEGDASALTKGIILGNNSTHHIHIKKIIQQRKKQAAKSKNIGLDS